MMKNKVKRPIGEHIRTCRELHGYSQDNLAYELNMSQSAYSRYETNQTVLTVDRLLDIAEILKVSPIELLYGKEYADKLTEACHQPVSERVHQAIDRIEKKIQDLHAEIAQNAIEMNEYFTNKY